MKSKSLFAFIGLFFSFLTVYPQNTTNQGDRSGTSGNNNSFFGFRSGEVTATNRNSFFGAFSGAFNTNGASNAFFGYNAGRENTEGNNNVFLGSNAGSSNTTGNANNFLGSNAGSNSISGNNNLFLGQFAGEANVDGSRNVYVGNSAGRNSLGNGNVFIGYQSGLNETRNNRLYIDNSDTDTPLIYGEFNMDQLGINTNNIPSGMTLSVGGNTLIEDSLFASNRVAIGTTEDDPGYSLTVKGKIHSQEIKVDLAGAVAPDYVFEAQYELRSLEEVANYIQEHGHLPGIPSAPEMQENGLNLKEMNLRLLEKIEELTLYLISENTMRQEQQRIIADLMARVAKLEAKDN